MPSNNKTQGTNQNDETEQIHPPNNNDSKPPVRFHESTNTTPKTSKKKEKSTHPAKVKVSKKEFFQHLAAVVTLSVLAIVKLAMDARREAAAPVTQKSNRRNLLENVEKMHLALQDVVIEPKLPTDEQQQLKHVSKMMNGVGCQLYLAQSSIPGGGLGLFAAVPFEKEDVVIQGMMEGVGQLNPYFLSLKPHHLFHNVRTSDENMSFIASKPIEAGEELFFNMGDQSTSHQTLYETLNPSIPNKKTFDKADEIIKKVLDSIPMKERRVMKSRIGRNQQRVKLEPAISSTPILELMKQTLQEYDPEVAAIMMTDKDSVRSMMKIGGSAVYLSNKRSESWVRENGVCVDGLYLEDSRIQERGGRAVSAFASRDISEGDIVITAPILAMKYDNPDIEIQEQFCFRTIVESKMLLCPLSFGMFVKHGTPKISDSDSCTVEENCQNLSPAVNADYQWSEFNKLTNGLHRISPSDLTENRVTGLTIDIIAIKDIKRGEEVLISHNLSGKDEYEKSVLTLKDIMIPHQWRSS